MEVTTVCGTKIIQHTLQGSGIITLEPSCTLKTSEITIRGHYNVSSSIQSSYPRFSNFTLITNETEHISIISSTNQVLLNHTKQLNELQTQLHKADISTLQTDYHFDKHHHLTISYTALIISATLLICYIIWRIKKRRDESTQSPTPLPRQNTPATYILQPQET